MLLSAYMIARGVKLISWGHLLWLVGVSWSYLYRQWQLSCVPALEVLGGCREADHGRPSAQRPYCGNPGRWIAPVPISGGAKRFGRAYLGHYCRVGGPVSSVALEGAVEGAACHICRQCRVEALGDGWGLIFQWHVWW